MPEPTFMRRALDGNWYEGPIHEPKPDGDYSNWRDAVAENFDTMRVDVKGIKNLRDPLTTPRLVDLEKEYGQGATDNLTEDERRQALIPKRYRKATTGNISDLQALLDSGGYPLTAYNNSPDGPPVDPAVIMNQNFQMQALGGNHYAGNTSAFAGNLGGYWLVNGDTGNQIPGYIGAGNMWAGNTNAKAGFFSEYVTVPVDYETPTDPEDWSFVVFIGGAATFAGDGQILTIEQGFIPAAQQNALETLLLSFKGLYIWLGMVVTYT